MKEKLLYVAPECEQIAVAPRGVIAQSPTATLNLTNPFETTASSETSWDEDE